MVITITCNPAIDKTVYDNKTVFDIGGKGINVSKVLKELGIDSIATGFVGKENKDLVINDLNDNNIENHFIEVNGKARTNTKRIINGDLVEENEDGPTITQENINSLLNYVSSFSNDIVIISGSAPSSADKNIYKDIIDVLKKNGNYVMLDCAGQLFKNALKAQPDVIKPNKNEICEYFGIEYKEDEIIDKCKNLGIDFICVSLGKDGAIFISEDSVYKVDAIKCDVSSSVGAGDAMIAAIAYSKYNNLNIRETIKLAMASAAASCTTEGTKPPKYSVINNFIDALIGL